MIARQPEDKRAIGIAVLAACGRALEHVSSAPLLARVSDLVAAYERGECNRSYLFLRLEGIR